MRADDAILQLCAAAQWQVAAPPPAQVSAGAPEALRSTTIELDDYALTLTAYNHEELWLKVPLMPLPEETSPDYPVALTTAATAVAACWAERFITLSIIDNTLTLELVLPTTQFTAVSPELYDRVSEFLGDCDFVMSNLKAKVAPTAPGAGQMAQPVPANLPPGFNPNFLMP